MPYRSISRSSKIIAFIMFLFIFISISLFFTNSSNHQQYFKVPAQNIPIRKDDEPVFESSLIPQPNYLLAAHSASFAVLPDDSLIAVWFAGSHEGKPDVETFQSYFKDGQWTLAKAIVSREELSRDTHLFVKKLGNPVIYRALDNALHLFVVSVSVGGWSGSSINHLTSIDGGKTWRNAKKLILSPVFNISSLVRINPITLTSGGFYLPIYHEAVTILRDPEKRKFYDLQKKTIDTKNFQKQKDSFNEFIKLQDSEVSDQTKTQAKLNYDLKQLELDKKHGLDRDGLNKTPMNKADAEKKLNDILMEREQQEIEYIPKKIFDDTAFNLTDFNKAWEKRKIKDQRKTKNKQNDKSMILWDGISASNDTGTAGANFISVDTNYEDLYVDDKFDTSGFASKLSDVSDSASDLSSIGSENIDVSYVTDHDKNKEDVMKKWKNFESQRQVEDDTYEAREFTDKNVWGDVFGNPMNVSAQMGTMVGKDIKQLNAPQTKKTKLTSDMVEAYEQLLYEDKTDNTKQSDKKDKKNKK